MSAGELAHVLHLHQTLKETPWKADFFMLHVCCLDTQGNKLFPTVEDAEAIDPATAAKLLEQCVTTNSIGQTAAKKKLIRANPALLTLFRIARERGECVFTLADTLTADQLGWYEAYHELEPFTFVADDVRTGILAHAAIAANSKNPPSVAKLVPKWDQPDRLDAKQSNEALRQWAKSMNQKRR